jgi:hypothetical protein
MGCNCLGAQKLDFEYIKKLAIIYAKAYEEDVQIHVQSIRGLGKRVYDFERLGSIDRGNGIVEIIRFRDYQSPDVLPDSEGIVADTEGGTKVKGGSRKVKPEVVEGDVPVGDGETGDTA